MLINSSISKNTIDESIKNTQPTVKSTVDINGVVNDASSDFYLNANDRDINKSYDNIVNQYKIDLLNVISNDVFEDGTVSQSENYIVENFTQDNKNYILMAANCLYLEHFDDSKILTGLLIMVGSLKYSDVHPQGQTMALGLLQHKDIAIRDRAIQAFEKWNSKEGLIVLKSLQCEEKWLQKYVNKVISYIERDGI